MKTNKIKLIESTVARLAFDSGVHFDSELNGFYVRCGKLAKTYGVKCDLRRGGKRVRTVETKIGQAGPDGMSAREARNTAAAIINSIKQGQDPDHERREDAGRKYGSWTLEHALEFHISNKHPSPATADNYRHHVHRYLSDWRDRPLSSITTDEVISRRAKIVANCQRDYLERTGEPAAKDYGEPTANAVFTTLRTLFNAARKADRTITENPVEALHIPASNKRKLPPVDYAELWHSFDTLNPQYRDMYRTFFLTGARRASLLQVRCSDVNLRGREITFDHMKGKDDAHTIPISRKLRDILQARMEDDASQMISDGLRLIDLGSEEDDERKLERGAKLVQAGETHLQNGWLWPSPTSEAGHITEPKRKGIPSPHKIRSYYKEATARAGLPYDASAVLLGHTLPGESFRYLQNAGSNQWLRPHVDRFSEWLDGELDAHRMLNS